MARILMFAEPFGFGPAGSLMLLRNLINNKEHKWRYLGANYTDEIVNRVKFDKVKLLDANEMYKFEHIGKELDWAQVIISGTDFEVVRHACTLHKKVVIFDPISWYWKKFPLFYDKDMLYICQNFTGVEERINSLSQEIKANFVISAPPIYKKRENNRVKKGQVLVNMSGFYNPVHVLDAYPEFVLGCFVDALKLSDGWDNIIFTGNRQVIEKLNPNSLKRGFKFNTFSHQDMLSQIAQSALFFTTPGLNSCLEAFAYGTPTFFLPPQNDSQLFQLLEFQNQGLAIANTDWYSIAGNKRFQPTKSQKVEIKKLDKYMHYCINNREYRDKLVQTIATALNWGENHWYEIAQKQRQFLINLRKKQTSLSEILAGEFERMMVETENRNEPVKQ